MKNFSLYLILIALVGTLYFTQTYEFISKPKKGIDYPFELIINSYTKDAYNIKTHIILYGNDNDVFEITDYVKIQTQKYYVCDNIFVDDFGIDIIKNFDGVKFVRINKHQIIC